MKGLWSILVVALACLQAQESHAIPFRNLDFEAAELPVIPPFPPRPTYVPITQALPGWSAYLGVDALTEAIHNNITVGSPAVLIYGPDMPYSRSGRIEGDFTAVLFTGSASSGPSLSISQTGLVPWGSRWLFFKGWAYPESGDGFAVSLNGENVPMSVVATYADYTLYGGSVSAFAGTEAELKFTVSRGLGYGLTVDSIRFSPVPEPGPVALFGIGLASVGLWRYRNRRNHRLRA